MTRLTPRSIPAHNHLHKSKLQASGLAQSIEDVIFRAQAEDEQERRLISRQPATPLTAPVVEASVTTPNAADEKATPPAQAAPRAEVIPVNRPADIKPTVQPERIPREKAEAANQTPATAKENKP